MCTQIHTSVRNWKTYEFISMDKHQIGMMPFEVEVQK